MSKPPRDRFLSDSRTYFVSANTWGSRALFQAEDLARLFLETLYGYRAQRKYLLHEFVLMPTHFHILLTSEVTLERSLQLIKGGFSFRARAIVGREKSGSVVTWITALEMKQTTIIIESTFVKILAKRA